MATIMEKGQIRKYSDKEIDELLENLPDVKVTKTPTATATKTMLRVYKYVAKGWDNFAIAQTLGMDPRYVAVVRTRIAQTFGNIKEMLGTQALYAQLQITKAQIIEDIENLQEIAKDKTIDPELRLEAIKASLSTKMLSLRIEFDGIKAIMELEDIVEHNKELYQNAKKDSSKIPLSQKKNFVVLPESGITFLDAEHVRDADKSEKTEGPNQKQESEGITTESNGPEYADTGISQVGDESDNTIDDGFNSESKKETPESGDNKSEKYIRVGSNEHATLIESESNFQV